MDSLYVLSHISEHFLNENDKRYSILCRISRALNLYLFYPRIQFTVFSYMKFCHQCANLTMNYA